MGKKIQESYLALSNALADLGKDPQCADPLYSDWFFVEPVYEEGKLSPRAIQQQLRADEVNAKLICDFCPVKVLCAEYAVIANEQWGIWGATTPAERKLISSFSRSNKPEHSTAKLLFD
jgi:hypothetical protein